MRMRTRTLSAIIVSAALAGAALVAAAPASASVDYYGQSLATSTASYAVGAFSAGVLNPQSVATTPDGSKVFVASGTDGTVAELDGTSGTVINPLLFRATGEVMSLFTSPDGRRLYIQDDNGVTAVDLSGHVLARYPDADATLAAALSPDGGTLYTASWITDTPNDVTEIDKYDVSTGADTPLAQFDGYADELEADSDGVYATDEDNSRLIHVNSSGANPIAASLGDSACDLSLCGIAIVGQQVFVANGNSAGNVSYLPLDSAAAVAPSLAVGNEPSEMDALGSDLVVASDGDDKIYTVNAQTHSVIGSVAVAGHPVDIAAAKDASVAYAVLSDANEVVALRIGSQVGWSYAPSFNGPIDRRLVIGSKVSVTVGDGLSIPAVARYDVVWLLATKQIGTGSTLTVPANAAGKHISAQVSMYSAIPGMAPTVVTKVIGTAVYPPIKTTKPKMTGTPQVGKTLTIVHEAWMTKVHARFWWYANGKMLKTRGPKLTLTKALVGKKISAVVDWPSSPGRSPGVYELKDTKPVKKAPVKKASAKKK